jgi:hypothetical protein
MYILQGSLCIFPGDLIQDHYLNHHCSKTDLKSSFYTKCLKNNEEYEYKFEKLDSEQLFNLDECKQLDIYEHLHSVIFDKES